ncbi:hypothetical protein [Mycolicibacterium porcinum]
MFTSNDMHPVTRRKAWGIIAALLLIAALMMQLVSPAPAWIGGERGFGAALSWAEPWPPGPGPGPGPGPDFGSGGGSQFMPPSMPSNGGSYSGSNIPAPAQGNGIDINNPASQMPAGEQGSAAQYPAQGPRTPVHGHQPPNYDLPPQQATQQQPAQQPTQQQPQREQPEQQQPQQKVEQQPQNTDNEQQRQNQCQQQNSLPPSRPRTAKEDEVYQALRKKSPDEALNKRVGRDWGLLDDAGNLTGYPKDWVVDHVIPIERIVLIPGFVNITSFDVQKMIVELPENTFPLGPGLNSSKSNKVPKEWPGYVKKTGEAMSPEQYAALCDQQDIAIQRIMTEINAQNVASKTSPSSPGTAPEVGNVPGRQHLPQPTAPDTAPPQAPTQAPTESPSAPRTAPQPVPRVPRTSGPQSPAPRPGPAHDPVPYEPSLVPSTIFGDPVPAAIGLAYGSVFLFGGLLVLAFSGATQ